jgi:hypothetical protein
MLALATAALGGAAAAITIAPAGCASDCANNCPPSTATIATNINADPGIIDLAWVGPACPMRPADCRGDDQTTQCNRIDVTGVAVGYCDVYIQLIGRDPMAVHIEFGPPPATGCCKGFAVIGESRFVIPLSVDAGITGVDGPSDAVSVPHEGGVEAGSDAADGGADDAAAD